MRCSGDESILAILRQGAAQLVLNSPFFIKRLIIYHYNNAEVNVANKYNPSFPATTL